MKVLELFSGIGGMRAGLTLTSDEHHEFVPVDLNEGCNSIYKDSYGDKPLSLDIASLPVAWFTKIRADVWTMSPPCQPYTRQGNQRDSQDARAKPLTHLCAVLKQLDGLPKMIVLENVKNFELSDSFQELKSVLQDRGYSLYGYLLNPLYMGFPNSRLRFFLIAKLDHVANSFHILTNDPQVPDYERISLKAFPDRPIGDFLCRPHSCDGSKLQIPRSLLEKQSAFCFDIVSAESLQSLCFTRAYTQFVNGTGSVLYSGRVSQMDEMKRPTFQIQSMAELEGFLHYFCPLEAARLNGFSVNGKNTMLQLREGCAGGKKYYKAVGNSLNPHVVASIVSRHR